MELGEKTQTRIADLPPERAELLQHVAANFSAVCFQAFVRNLSSID